MNPRKLLALCVSIVMLGLPTANIATAQTSMVGGAMAKLQLQTYSMSMLDWMLLELNISRAYPSSDNWTAGPIRYNPQETSFSAKYYVPGYSPLLKVPASMQMEIIETEGNNVWLGVHTSILLPLRDSYTDTAWKKLANELRTRIEVIFVTREESEWYAIARYENGQVQLVHEVLDFF